MFHLGKKNLILRTVATKPDLALLAFISSNARIPDGLTVITSDTIRGRTDITSLTIPSSVTNISSSAFRTCTNLTSIIIEKSEGSISGAPWGATGATVSWNA